MPPSLIRKATRNPSSASVDSEATPRKPELASGNTFDSLFNNSKYADVKLYLGESKTQFLAHQVVLGTRSPYFDDALRSEFKEGITHEFTYDKDSPHALWRVLQYMYTGNYTDEPSECLESEGDDLELLKHPRVYALADMFRMEELKTLSCKKFELQLQQHWITDAFPDCIREVYTISMEGSSIRKAVVDAVFSHKKALVQKRAFQEVVREVGDFAIELVLKMTNSDAY
ncbi:hypothetical protein V494_02644 [Pseudogymnoascus sp. VKM F-4513 (FW-928)]|nr:hypothetical protein V494_02644 [Pseudogymnoascus sp. VKM F-4513 (FW-928)]